MILVNLIPGASCQAHSLEIISGRIRNDGGGDAGANKSSIVHFLVIKFTLIPSKFKVNVKWISNHPMIESLAIQLRNHADSDAEVNTAPPGRENAGTKERSQ